MVEPFRLSDVGQQSTNFFPVPSNDEELLLHWFYPTMWSYHSSSIQQRRASYCSNGSILSFLKSVHQRFLFEFDVSMDQAVFTLLTNLKSGEAPAFSK